MKRFVALLLAVTLLLTGCISQKPSVPTVEVLQPSNDTVTRTETVEFSGLDDPELLEYVESEVYQSLLNEIDTNVYFVENVDAVYLSKEYLEEVAYNSKENIFFGYTLSELDTQFQGTRYVFTLGDDGQTTVKAFEKYDDTYERVLKNVAIGTGIIFICVTVSVISGGTGAPAISAIFAASAKTGTVFALSSGFFGGLSSGIITGIETKDFDQALKAAALAGSEGFKWGAFTGALLGGGKELCALKGATLNGLTINEAAAIQKDSKLSLDFIKSFHSMDEYNVYKDAQLQAAKVNGNWAYIRDIDWDFEYAGKTNAERVIDGLSPMDELGKPYQLHHIGQKPDSPLAILTSYEHQTNNGILHVKKESEIDRNAFEKIKDIFWLSIYEMSLES